MGRITLKGLLAHKLRLALTAIAIILGVTFVSGTFILTDTLHNTFTTLLDNVYAHVDFQIRGVSQFTGTGVGAERNPIPASILPAVLHLPGVADTEGGVEDYAQFISKKGKAISNGGAPTEGVSYATDPRISELHVVSGKAPTTSSEVVMDAGTAKKYHFSIGNRVRVLLRGPTRTFTISGIARFGNANNLAGITIAAFDTPTAQALFNQVGETGGIDVITTPGTNQAALQRSIAKVLPKGVQVVSGETVVSQETASVDQALGFFQTALLVFAFISLFVGAFTILNTFSIIVGQRTRELALLRAVGASRRQVFRSVIGEAAIVGLVSSIVGIGLGVLAAIGLEALLRGFGITLPSGPPVFEARTVIVALLVGVGVTVIASISPARRAVRIPPVAALGGVHGVDDIPLRRRFIWGSVVAILGMGALALGLSKPAIGFVGLGALFLFVGVAMLSPAIARPVSSLIGRPLARFLGVAGTLGRENSMRSPRRTAQTAAALMVGIALVSAIAVFGASLATSSTSSVDHAISADLIVSTTGSATLSTAIPTIAAAVPGVTATSTVYGGRFKFRNTTTSLAAVSATALAKTLIVRTVSGSTSVLSMGELLIDTTTATSDHLKVGDSVPVKFALTGSSRMRIGGIFKSNALIGSFLVGDGFYLRHFRNPSPIAILLQTDGRRGVEAAVRTAVKAYPDVQVQSRAEFEKTQTAQVNKLLGLVYALLGLAVIIALIGIVNTLMLSVFERTHEIGLLRAVGMKRRQVRLMIRSESVILSLFGALVGVVVGTGLGIALVTSLHTAGIADTVVPGKNLIIFLVLSAVLGLAAASWPARRAAKLDVLAAIAAD